jgi:probable phosphoglycerate mutase
MARAVQTAEIAAAVLGVGVQVREGLREFSVGEHHGKEYDAALFDPTFTRWLAGDLAATVPGGESGAEVVGRMREEIELMADLYRGESVLVVSHGGAMCAALPQLSRNLPGDYPAGRPLGNCDVVEAAVDADGLVVRAWAGERSAGWA